LAVSPLAGGLTWSLSFPIFYNKVWVSGGWKFLNRVVLWVFFKTFFFTVGEISGLFPQFNFSFKAVCH
jgi:hypothetical protein